MIFPVVGAPARPPPRDIASSFRGVFWNKVIDKWHARIRLAGVWRDVGASYDNEFKASEDFEIVYALRHDWERQLEALPSERERIKLFKQLKASVLGPRTREGQGVKHPARQSPYPGLSRKSDTSKWFAKIRIDGAYYAIGRYADDQEASRHYETIAKNRELIKEHLRTVSTRPDKVRIFNAFADSALGRVVPDKVKSSILIATDDTVNVFNIILR